ncbi:hypothetical protein CMV_003415 [Castanea mollissima]|uniref:Receptor-like serine/threonine-protein kinase n=1 Tax=Castanea mollissima TaxID=60419 RepID=A0A8J4RTD3_9ROSI|nr:hypothetical protein CMV_003415 [Castanea mollissima]
MLQVLDTSSRKVHWKCYHRCYSCPTANLIVNLTDSGNLALYSNDIILWESFDTPTDTFLPGMSMSSSMKLTSWRDRDDPGSGNYTIKRDPLDAGDLGTLIIYRGKTIYWKSWKDDRLSNISYLFSFEASVNFDYDRRSDPDFDNVRLVMNFSGMIEFWKQKNRTWSLIEAEPRDDCSVYNFCGKFGSCNPNNKLVCKCLPGFMPDVPEKWHSGDFSNGCAKNDKSCGDGDLFLSLKMIIGGENPQGIYEVNNENECKETCLKNCECKSYSYDEQRLCQIWTQDLLNLQEEHPYGHNLSVRVAISDIEPTVRNCVPCGTNMIPYPLSTSSNCGDPMYYSFDCNTTTGQVSFKAPSGTYRVSGIDPNTQKFFIQVKDGRSLRLNQSLPFNLTKITNDVEIAWDPPLEPICNLTADCEDWPHSSCKSASDGKRRCLCTVSFQWDGTNLNCTRVSWPSEKRIISLLIVGITSVIVLCVIIVMYIWRRKMTKRKEHGLIDQRNRAHRMLCSESHVQDLIDLGEFKEEDEKGIDLPFYDLESIRVATHNFSNENKLGQGGYGPVYKGKLPSGQEIAVKRLSKVSGQDFGLAKIVSGKQTEAITSRVAGTYGYMSPEYALEGIFSIKSDVFSFGVVLLEIISGKKNTGFYQSQQAMSLLGYTWGLWTNNKLLDLMDETLRDTCIADQFVKCLNIGLLCVQDDPSDRPTMSIVIKMLDGETLNLPTPKQPAFFIRRDQSNSTSSNKPESINEVTISLEGR